MKYISTRQSGGAAGVSVAQAIVEGLAPDGGLYVPEEYPQLTIEDIESLIDKDYVAVSRYVASKYLEGFSQDELTEIVSAAYSDNFDDPSIVPIITIDENQSILELFHGPTLAFKDMALQMLPRLLISSMEKTGETRKVLILVATSGDTGKAALEGFCDVPGTGIIVFYPNQGVSALQELQMRAQEGKNVAVCAVHGNFDDAQSGVKDIFSDGSFESKMSEQGYVLSSANSINFGRLLPQIAYYFWSYIQLVKKGKVELGDEINFSVPTGNFGNILAAYYAKQMGLPIYKLICASNQNNVLSDFFSGGVYDKNREFYKTSSPSMDILVSSNLERLLFEMCGRDGSKVNDFMQKLKTSGRYEIEREAHEKIAAFFSSGYANEDQVNEIIKRTWQEKEYVLDPHTAVAQSVYERYAEETGDRRQVVVVSTASPFKFADSVLDAIDPSAAAAIDHADPLGACDALCAFTNQPIPKRAEELRGKPAIHGDLCEKQDMKAFVETVIARWDQN